MSTSIIEQLKHQRDSAHAEAEKYRKKAEQAKNNIARLENKQKYLSQKERNQRTHQLCNIGGALAHFYPQLLEQTREEIYDFVEKLFINLGGETE